MAFIKRNWKFFTALSGVLIILSTFLFSFHDKSIGPSEKDINIITSPEIEKMFAYTPAQAANIMSRTLNSSYQVSEQRSGIVVYNVLVTNTATLILGNTGQVILETSPNNSTWTTISTGQSGVGSGLVFSGNGTQTIFGFVPRGYWVRLRTNNVTGTPTYGSPAGMEILIN